MKHMKHTAVEWLQKALSLTFEQQMQFEGLFQQAKEIEKQQIIDAYWDAYKENQYSGDKVAEEYYQETYVKSNI